ncbi:MAG TPA: hypothetical protein VLE22_27855 [Bryobacteraceae bacterium]|nr:hypothetical protein [Bryobacteraceae bacterium]
MLLRLTNHEHDPMALRRNDERDRLGLDGRRRFEQEGNKSGWFAPGPLAPKLSREK